MDAGGDGVHGLESTGNHQCIVGRYLCVVRLILFEKDQTAGLIDHPDGVD